MVEVGDTDTINPLTPALTQPEPLKNSQFTVAHPVPLEATAVSVADPPLQMDVVPDADKVGSGTTVICTLPDTAGFGLHPVVPQAYKAR